MALSIEDQNGVVVAILNGQLQVGNSKEFKERVRAIYDQGALCVVIDFGECGYVDVTGLQALISIDNKRSEVGGNLVLVDFNDDLQYLFELVKLDTRFRVVGAGDYNSL